MADPTKYVPGYSYSNYQASNPTKPLPADEVDNDFANIKRTTDQVVDAVKDVRRSDGKLKNQSVGPDQLSPALTIGFTFTGTWVDGRTYSAGDGVVYGSGFYSAREDHTADVSNAPGNTAYWNFLFSLDDIVVTGGMALPRDSFVGDGTTTAFTLSFVPLSKFNVFVQVGGVVQATDAYSTNGNTLTFTSPPPNGYGIEVRGFATTASLVTPEDGSVTTAKLADLSVTTQKLVNGSVTGPKLGEGAVGTANVADEAITEEKLEAGVAAKIPAIVANTMPVDNAAGAERQQLAFSAVRGVLGYFDTETAFLAATISSALQYVDIAGKTTKGDGGHHRKVRIAGPGTELWQLQSADGTWWDIADQAEYMAEIFGLGAGGADTVSWELAADFITTRGGTLRVPAGEITLTNDWSVTSAASPFKIIGAGKDVTIFKRADTGTVAFWNIVNSSDYIIADLTLDCQRSNVAVGTGSHALRMDRGENITVHRVKVTDYTDTGIIFFDTADAANGLHDNVSVIECECDGLSNANNGILLNNTRRGLMAHNKVINLGRQGAPQFAIQFKARNVDGKSIGNWIENCRGGVAIGSTDVAAPSNVNCHSSFEIVKGATRALRATYSSFCTMHAEVIDMDEASDAGNPTEDTDEHAVFLNQVDNCVIRIGHLRSYEDTKYVVALPTAVGCTVVIDTWRNVPNTSKFLDLGAGASGNVIEIKNYVGTRFDFPMDMVQNASGSANTFRMGDDVMAQRTVIASDAVTILNPAVARYRLDTEAAAATDNLATINGGTDGQVVVFTTTSDARDVVLKHNTGNIFLKGAVDRTLGSINDIVMLMFSSFANKWIEI